MKEDCKEQLEQQACCGDSVGVPGMPGMPGIPGVPTRAREIRIRSLNRGFVVGLECHEFAFEDLEKMLTYVNQYIRNPKKVEAMWFRGQLFNE